MFLISYQRKKYSAQKNILPDNAIHMRLLGYTSIPAAILTLYTLSALTGKGKHNNDGECQHQAWEEWNSTIIWDSQ